jgi:flavorubredoxin
MASAVADGATQHGAQVTCHRITALRDHELRSVLEDADALVFGVPTVNRDVPKPMQDMLAVLSTVKLKANRAAVFGSYGWSGEACSLVAERLKGLGIKVVTDPVRAQFTPREDTLAACRDLGRRVSEALAI